MLSRHISPSSFVGVFLARAPLDQPVELLLRRLARYHRASEIAVQGRPDWLVLYQHDLLLQTNVCICIMPRFSEGFIYFSMARQDRGK